MTQTNPSDLVHASSPEIDPDLGMELLLHSGFEEEQPEPDFDERV